MIARKSVLIMFVQICNAILGYVGLKFISLYMQPWEYGIIGFAYGFVAIFSFIGNMGYGTAHIKKISEGKDLGTCIGTFTTTKLFLSGMLASSVVIFIFLWKNLLGRGFESGLHEQAVYILLAYFVLVNISSIVYTTFNARKETAKTQLPLLIYNLVRVAVVVFVVYNRMGVIALSYSYLIGEIFHLTILYYLFRKYPINKPSKEYFLEYTSFAIHMFLVVVSALIITNVDKVLIQLFWSSKEVGEYFAVYNLSRYLILFSSAISALIFPTISEHFSKKNTGAIRGVLEKADRYLSMIIIPLVFIMVILSEPIVRILLSDKYLPAISILQILPFFALFEVLSGPFTAQLQGMNNPKIVRNRIIIMMVLNVFLNLLLIPNDIQTLNLKLFGLGSQGAAIATVLSYLSGLIYIRYKAWKQVGYFGSLKTLKHLFSAIIVVVITYFIISNLSINRWFQLLPVGLLFLGFYLLVLTIIKEFNKDDFNYLLETLNIKEMIRYIKEEFKN